MLDLLSSFNICFMTTDDYGRYTRKTESGNYLVENVYTVQEQHNLNLRILRERELFTK
uniref:IS1 family transposase n=1 Tax=Xenorhabdus sp. TH1 TaxID=3130166 RepID=UPI00404021F3